MSCVSGTKPATRVTAPAPTAGQRSLLLPPIPTPPQSLPRPRNHFSFSWFQRVSGPTVIFVLHCRHSLLIHNCGLVPATSGRGSVLQPVERVVATTGGCAANNFPQQQAAIQLIPSFPSSLHFPSQPTFSSGNAPTISAKTETEGGITGNYFQRRAQAPRPQDSARSKGETDLNFENIFLDIYTLKHSAPLVTSCS